MVDVGRPSKGAACVSYRRLGVCQTSEPGAVRLARSDERLFPGPFLCERSEGTGGLALRNVTPDNADPAVSAPCVSFFPRAAASTHGYDRSKGDQRKRSLPGVREVHGKYLECEGPADVRAFAAGNFREYIPAWVSTAGPRHACHSRVYNR